MQSWPVCQSLMKERKQLDEALFVNYCSCVKSLKYNPNIPQPDLVSQKTGVSGWRLVRYLVNGSTTWHHQNDNLAHHCDYSLCRFPHLSE
mgnify:CR=1 FL=1